ncbi:ectonucleotide pyrophosphatase/phosphodiesterase [Simiduia sp. 21SJ11W-1]|uniref:alkaline phosphatase family protein n=1 Tax=Simiduia sp. 21SJ11W-1 TaxID=2909669 RepID=UPI0020A05A08|nr:ectonucleotide pyrophosphatase/phosphodiesterase [Simiduia sp. 21SJ11W-1]UTA48287.1 ectonucleotide pyrophosphatase/phosphodiesterase [Simiduia sp. 21SJ11W-1]
MFAAAAPTSLTATSTEGHKPRLLLVSIDGYRHDYTRLHKPPFLSRFKEDGASLNSLRPVFPSKTFPNHLTLVTGVVPARHGIVYNHFYAPDLNAEYSLGDSAAVTNPDFYLAKPLWVLAQAQGLKTATYFWPGSEAPIHGLKPSIVKSYNKNTPIEARIDEVLRWVAMQGPDAPQFMSLYFSHVDDAGHHYGPHHRQTRNAVHTLDAALSALWQGIQASDSRVNLVIVSDHGMYPRQKAQTTPLFNEATHALSKQFRTVGSGPSVQFYRTVAAQNAATAQLEAERAVLQINAHAKHFRCMTPNQAPKHYRLQGTERMGDFICVANAHWNIRVTPDHKFPAGNHGWPAFEQDDPAAIDMHGIFYARGPAFGEGRKLPTQDNVHVMPLLAHILGIKLPEPAALDGKLEALAPLLKSD